MKNTLKNLKKKSSWKNTFCFPPVYYLKDNERVEDTDMASVCRKSGSLTLDFNDDTGFKEIGLRPFDYNLNHGYRFLSKDATPDCDDDYLTIIVRLKELLKQCFMELWDSKKPHLMFHSGGRDSRILSYTLAELRDELGEDWIGRIHFICHEPEGEFFKTVMKKQGWSDDQYSVFRESVTKDYYDCGGKKVNVNAFWNPGINFHSTAVKPGRENEWCLISGNFGGEQFNYRAKGSPFFKLCTNNRLQDFMTFSGNTNLFYSEGFSKWGDIIQPYLYYPFLKYSFSIPDAMFKTVRRGDDNIRDGILRTFNDDAPYHVGHTYNTVYTIKYRSRITTEYLSSKFYRNYRSIVKDAGMPGESFPNRTPSTKLYGLSTMYERI